MRAVVAQLLATYMRQADIVLAGDNGSASVESALVYVLLFLVVLALLDFSVMLFTYSVYTDAARYGARYASLHGVDSATCSGPSSGCGDQTGSNVVGEVTGYAARYLAPVAGVSVTVTYPDGVCTPGSRAVVSVAFSYLPMVNVPAVAYPFSATAQTRIIY